MDRFIVVELFKNWQDGEEVTRGSGLLAEKFELAIAANTGRGYRLYSWHVSRLLTGPDSMNETIIAVFETEDGKA